MTNNGKIRAELARLMGIDLDNASIADVMRLDRVLTLRLFIADQLATQAAGGEIDVRELAEASKMLDGLLPATPVRQASDQPFVVQFIDPAPLMPFIGQPPEPEQPTAQPDPEPAPEPGIVGRIMNAVVDTLTPSDQKPRDSKFAEVKARRRSFFTSKRTSEAAAAQSEIEALREEWQRLEKCRLAGATHDHLRLQTLPSLINAAERKHPEYKPSAPPTVEARDDWTTANGGKSLPAAPSLIEQLMNSYLHAGPSSPLGARQKQFLAQNDYRPGQAKWRED